MLILIYLFTLLKAVIINFIFDYFVKLYCMFGLGKYHLTEQKIFFSSTISNPNISIPSLLEYFKTLIITINLGIYNNFNSNLENIMSNFFIQLVSRVDTSPRNCSLIASNVYQLFSGTKEIVCLIPLQGG